MPFPQRRLSGVSLSLWIIAVIVSTLVPITKSISLEEKQRIKKGLQTGKEIFDFIKEHKFEETLKKVAEDGKAFLGVLGPFVGFIMAFVPSEDSEDLKYMKNMMKQIDTHFKRVDSSFDDVERLIKWTETAVKFGEIESSLNALTAEYILFYDSSAPPQNKKSVYIKSYDSNYKLAGTRLYQAMFIRQGVFNEHLGNAILRYTKNDRRKTYILLLGILDMVYKAIRLEAAYYEMSNFTIIKQERKKEWDKRTDRLQWRIDDIDDAAALRYLDQSEPEILEYARDNSEMSNEEFSSGLFSLLEKKYYWRLWFVLIYDPITGSDKNRFSINDRLNGKNCGGHWFLRQNGRNIVIASKDKKLEKMDFKRASTEIGFYEEWVTLPFKVATKLEVTHMSSPHRKLSNPYNAEEYYNTVDRTIGCCFAIVKSDAHVFYKCSEERVVTFNTRDFELFMFG